VKALLQRVAEARVVIDGITVGQIGAGLLVLVCAERGDAELQADKLIAKILKLRIFRTRRAPGRPKHGQPPRGAAQHTKWQAWGSISQEK
jgi:D-Tyr-tRNA(Tyr) deacylase